MKLAKSIFLFSFVVAPCSAYAAYHDAKFAFANHDYQGAFDSCIEDARSGDADCENAIGVLYLEGKSVAQSTRTAIQWFKRAADKDHAASQFNLGLAYARDQPGFRNFSKSAEAILKAAENGHVHAQLLIGNYFAEGMGVPIDNQKAFNWWKVAAERNSAMAQNNLGWAFLHGIGTEKNVEIANQWFEKAINQSNDLNARELATKNSESIHKQMPKSQYSEGISFEISDPKSDGQVELSLTLPASLGLLSLKINNEEVAFDNMSRKKFIRYLPLGESEIQLSGELSNGKNFQVKKKKVRSIGKDQYLSAGLGQQKFSQRGDVDAVAIIIGAEEYEKLPRSNFSQNDALRFLFYVQNVLKIPNHKIRMLGSKNAKRSDILLAFKNWLPSEINPGKTKVFVFYSGHGIASLDSTKYYLLPTDSNLQLLEETALGLDGILKLVQKGNPNEAIFMIDSCFSGVSRDGGVLTPNARPVLQTATQSEMPPRTTIISSASGPQISLSSEETGHGIFSYHLMMGLNGDADENNDRTITAQELHNYVARKVSIDARRRGADQQPRLVGGNDLVFLSGTGN